MNRVLSWRIPQAVFLSLLVAPAVGAGSSAALSASTAGMSIAVTNCNDRGPGSLRNAVARALSGDTIDMSGLACNAITLASGAIVIPQQNLRIQGPGRDRLTIKGSEDRVFDHQGAGLLRLRKFSVTKGVNPMGGCIYSEGGVELRAVRVHHCRAGGSPQVWGGGIFAHGNVSLYGSAVEFNNAVSTETLDDDFDESASGGGIYSLGRLRIEDSHICDNTAEAGDSRYERSVGGGASAAGLTANRANIYDNTSRFGGGGLNVGSIGNVSITNSTIARNTSIRGAGGIMVYSGGGTVTVRNSTFSGNTGGDFFGLEDIFPNGSALDVAAVDVTTITNSTITFNRNGSVCGGAVHAGDYGQIRLKSTIVAHNVCEGGSLPIDVRAANVEGDHNLIQATYPGGVPADTITADPQLAPLAANGGPTKTHALLAISPAVDAGANPYGLQYDQRGPGYPRVKGARADIGAYER